MTIVSITPTPAHAHAEPRDDCDSPAARRIPTLRRRLAARVRTALRDRQPMVTVSEQVLSGIHNVHSLHR